MVIPWVSIGNEGVQPLDEVFTKFSIFFSGSQDVLTRRWILCKSLVGEFLAYPSFRGSGFLILLQHYLSLFSPLFGKICHPFL